MNRDTTKKLFLNVIKSFMGILFPLITYKYASSVLLPEGVGRYTYVLSISSYFLLVAQLGISPYAIAEGPKIRDNKKKFNVFATEIFTISIFTTLFAYVLLFIFVFITKDSIDSKMLLICSISMLLNAVGTSWIFNIYEDFLFITIRTVAFQAISLVLLIVFVKSPNDLYLYALISVLSSYGSNIFNIFHSRKYAKCRLSFMSKKIFAEHMKPIILLFCASAASTIYMNSDKVMIGLLSGDREVGMYTTAVKIVTVVTTVVVAIREVFLPKIAHNIFCNRIDEEARKLIYSGIRIIYIIVIPSIFLILSLSDALIRIVATPEYTEASLCLRVLCLELLFVPINAFLAYQVLVPIQQTKIVTISTSIAAVANVALNFVFIPLFGYSGAAITTVVAEIIVFLCLYNKIRQQLSLSRVFTDIVKMCISAVPIILVKIALSGMTEQWIETFIVAGVGGLIYMLMTDRVFRIIDYRNLKLR